MAIRINSENKNRKRKVDLEKIGEIAIVALKALSKNNTEVNIVFVSNQKIRAINRRYLGIDAATDVIAFPPGEEMQGKRKKEKGKSMGFLGDVAISSDKAYQNAKIYGATFTEEVALYVIHGILHLSGYKDATKNEQARMRRKESEFLQKIRKYL